MAGKTDPPLPLEWTQRPPNDEFSYFTNGDKITVLLQTLDTFTLRSLNKFQSQRLHIYAETIQIDGDITLPGKELGLFCNKFLLPAGQSTATISVTGAKGINGVPNQAIGDTNHGKKGGNLMLCIEEFDPLLLPDKNREQKKTGLYLQAYGGDGGNGATGVGNKGGGPAGNGGDGGNITVYYGHAIFGVMNNVMSLVNDSNIPWLSKLTNLRDYDFKVPVSEGNKNRLVDLAKQTLADAKPLDEIRQLLRLISFDRAPDGTSPSESAAKLTSLIEDVQRCSKELNMGGATRDAIQKSHDVLDQFRQANPPYTTELWKGFEDSTALLLTELKSSLEHPVQDSDSQLRATLGAVTKELQARVNHFTSQMRVMHSCRRGQGGVGGAGAIAGSERGSNGDAGKLDGKLKVHPLDFSGSENSLAYLDPVAHPDQCQMLLNRADLMYYAASGGQAFETFTKKQLEEQRSKMKPGFSGPKDGSLMTAPTGGGSSGADSLYGEAGALYQRILKRLHFVPAVKRLLKLSNSKDTQSLTDDEKSKYSLVMAYAAMAANNLCLDPIIQIMQVHDHAVQRLNWIATGKDFMGHEGLWAPRLTYSFYETELAALVPRSVELAKSFQEVQDEEKTKAAIQRSVEQCDLQLRGLEARIKVISGSTGGQLKVIGSQIAEYTPILKAKRNELQASIIAAKVEIAKKINFDPKFFLDALCMIAFCPDAFNVAAQTSNGIYQAATTVQSTEGHAVNKKYVISQFGDAGDSIEKLTEGYKARPDGQIDVDDPGATKLLSTKANLTKLLNSFKKDIPELHKVIESQLEHYVGIIEKRNRAVIEYNAAVQLLAKALADQEFYQHRSEELGQLQLSATAPSIRLWLLKYRQDLRYNILSTLYRGERALQFWGLNNSLAALPAAQDFSDIDLLRMRTDALKEVFKESLTNRSDNPGTVWPAVDQVVSTQGRGKFFHLPSDLVKTFRDRPTEMRVIGSKPPSTYLLYQAYFAIPPVLKTSKKSFADLAGHADVRIDSARAWLYGAAVGKRDNKAELRLSLIHLGTESIVREDNEVFEFDHDAVRLDCTYDPTGIKEAADIPKSIGYDTQKLNSFRSLVMQARDETNSRVSASFGPFAHWCLSVSSEDNLDLDMSGLTDIAIEFSGESRGFK